MTFSIASLRTCGDSNPPFNGVDWGTISLDLITVAGLGAFAGVVLGGLPLGIGNVGDLLAWGFVASGGIILFIDAIVLSVRLAKQKKEGHPNPWQDIPSSSRPAQQPNGKVSMEQIHSAAKTALQSLGEPARPFYEAKAYKQAVNKSIALARFVVLHLPERAQAVAAKVENTAKTKGQHLSQEELSYKTNRKIFKLAFKTHLILAVDKAICDNLQYSAESIFAPLSMCWPNGKVQPWTKLFYQPIFARQTQNGKHFHAFPKQIGEGGYNTTGLMFDILEGQKSVYRQLKLDKETEGENREIRRKWVEETKWHHYLQRLLGPLVPQLFEVLDASNGTFTEHCDEGDLVDASESKTATEIKVILLDVLRGLGIMHGEGIVHADIKADNILVHQGGGKLSDFGGTFSIKNPPNYLPGETYEFRAPEAMQIGAQVGVEMDMWAFGILAYQIKYRTTPKFLLRQGKIFREAGLGYNNSHYHRLIKPNLIAGIAQLRKKLDPSDPYDRVILGCLNMDPKKRTTAKEAHAILTKANPRHFETSS